MEQGVYALDYTEEELLGLLQARYGPFITLELGPGKDDNPWASIGLNESADPKADIFFDLEFGIPLPRECIAKIVSNQTLEHIGEGFIRLMNSCWRVLKPGGTFQACVPHWKSPYAWGDPTHRRVFTEVSFDYFCVDETGRPFVESFSDYGIVCAFEKVSQRVRPGVDITVILKKPETKDGD